MRSEEEWFHSIYLYTKKKIRKKFVYLGQGISRKVYAINDDYVIKLAKGHEGLYQNKVEYYIFTHASNNLKKYLCPIIWFKPRMIVMKRAVPLSELTNNKNIDLKTIRTEKKAFEELTELYERFFLLYEDIISTSSWGILNEEKVLVDYGCTNDLGDLFYDIKFSLMNHKNKGISFNN